MMKILVIRLSSIGDIILTTPVLEALHTRYPDARIDFLVMDRFKDAIEGVPWIDELILFSKTSSKGFRGLLQFADQIAGHDYDMVIDLHAKIRSIVICSRLNAKVIRYSKRAWWKSILVPLRLSTYQVDDTIVRNYFRPLKKIGVHYAGERLLFHYNESHLITPAIPTKDFMVMAPGAANPTKEWLPEYFGRLGCMLSGNVVLVGGKTEFEICEDIRRTIGERCTNMAGKLTLKESGALISQARYVVTNDSGPFHIARGVGTKAFVIFGPTDPGMFTYDENAILLYEGLPCSPCSLHGDKKCPRGHFKCMQDLTPEKVFTKISGLL